MSTILVEEVAEWGIGQVEMREGGEHVNICECPSSEGCQLHISCLVLYTWYCSNIELSSSRFCEPPGLC